MGAHGFSGVFLRFFSFSITFYLKLYAKSVIIWGNRPREAGQSNYFERIDEQMSASASKKKRKELEEQGLSGRAIAEQKAKEQKNKTLKNVLIVALAVLVCAAAIFAVVKLVSRPKYDVKAPAVTVGEEKVTVPVYDYIYNLAASNFYNSYSFFIQAGTPLSQQQSIFGEGTMEDYMKQMASSNLKEILNVTAKAKAEGFQLSDEQLKEIDSAVESLEQEAKQYGFSNADRYLTARFGEGCNTDNYKDYLKLYMTFSAFATKLNEDFQPSQEELNASYEADKSAYDLVSFTYHSVAAESTKVESSDKPAEGEKSEGDNTAATAAPTTYTDEAKAAAKEKAEGYKTEMPEDASTVSYNKSTAESYLTAEIAEWLFDESRKEGDVEVFSKDENETLFYTVRFDSRDTNDYYRVNANIISIPKDKEDANTDASKDSTDASKDSGDEKKEETQTAEQKRDALIAAIQEGMSDEDFDKAITALGYTAAAQPRARNYSIEEIRDFLFDENRKAGDLLTTCETDAYYYVVRYVSQEEETYRNQMVHDSMWQKYYEDIAGANEITVDEELLKFAYTDLTFNAASTASEG